MQEGVGIDAHVGETARGWPDREALDARSVGEGAAHALQDLGRRERGAAPARALDERAELGEDLARLRRELLDLAGPARPLARLRVGEQMRREPDRGEQVPHLVRHREEERRVRERASGHVRLTILWEPLG